MVQRIPARQQLRELRAAEGLTEALGKNIDAGLQTMSEILAKSNADVDVNPDASWCASAGGGEGSEYCRAVDDMAAG